MQIGALGVLTSGRGVETGYPRAVVSGEAVAPGPFHRARFSGASDVVFPKDATARLALVDVE